MHLPTNLWEANVLFHLDNAGGFNLASVSNYCKATAIRTANKTIKGWQKLLDTLRLVAFSLSIWVPMLLFQASFVAAGDIQNRLSIISIVLMRVLVFSKMWLTPPISPEYPTKTRISTLAYRTSLPGLFTSIPTICILCISFCSGGLYLLDSVARTLFRELMWIEPFPVLSLHQLMQP